MPAPEKSLRPQPSPRRRAENLFDELSTKKNVPALAKAEGLAQERAGQKKAAQVKHADQEFELDVRNSGRLDPMAELGMDVAKTKMLPDLKGFQYSIAGQNVGTKEAAKRWSDVRRTQGGGPDIEPGDFISVGAFAGSKEIVSHEYRHEGLNQVRAAFTPEEFIEHFLPNPSPVEQTILSRIFGEGPGGSTSEALMDQRDSYFPPEKGYPAEGLGHGLDNFTEKAKKAFPRVEEAFQEAAIAVLTEQGRPPPTKRVGDLITGADEPERGWLAKLLGWK